MAASHESPWIWCPRPRPAAAMRLFCIPCAGRGASVFRAWPDRLGPSIEVCAIQLPGREGRLSEPAFTSADELTPVLLQHLLPFLGRSFAFFGHSLGALIAFELARRLRHCGVPGPEALVVAGCAAPHIPRQKRPLRNLPEDELIDELGRMNGTPREVLASRELMKTMVPLLRADFSVCETYRLRSGPPLSCPIVAYGGADDPDVTAAHVDEWRRHTIGPCTVAMMPGDHFFVYAPDSAAVAQIAQELQRIDRRLVPQS